MLRLGSNRSCLPLDKHRTLDLTLVLLRIWTAHSCSARSISGKQEWLLGGRLYSNNGNYYAWTTVRSPDIVLSSSFPVYLRLYSPFSQL